jgi:hypothetical protein
MIWRSKPDTAVGGAAAVNPAHTPLHAPLRSGGRLVFELRTSKGQWLRSGDTSASFLISLDAAASAAGLPPAPGPPAPPSAPAGPVAPAAPAAPPAAAAVEKQPAPAAAQSPKPAAATERPSAEAAGKAAGREAAAGLEGGPAASAWDAAAEAAAAAADASWDLRSLLLPADLAEGDAALLGGVAGDVVDEIAAAESKAERSLMHRFQIAGDLVRSRVLAPGAGDAGAARALAAVAVWLRLSSLRLLRW